MMFPLARTSAPTGRTTGSHLPAENNFDLIRLLLALTVVLWHIRVLSGVATFQLPLSADVAVEGFFVISGFLICASYEASNSLRSYALKRISRIYPAYLCVVLISVILGAALTDDIRHYFSVDLAKYLLFNLTFLNFLKPSLPGVFDGNAIPAVNGALWTLKIEVSYYLAVPLISIGLRRRYRFPFIVGIYILSFFYKNYMTHLYDLSGSGYYLQLAKQLPGFMTYFIVGSAAYWYRQNLLRYRYYVFIAAAVLWPFQFPLIQPLLVGALVLCTAFMPKPFDISRYGDISYGVYIYHFPIAQTLVSLGLFARSPGLGFVVTLSLTLLAAAVSWTAVENPCLEWNRRFLARAGRPTRSVPVEPFAAAARADASGVPSS